jgi:hypothetical protein
VDWGKDGTFAAFGDDVTAYVRPRIDPLTAQYGRDQSTALAPTVSGSGGLTLDNRTRIFSPRNTASLLFGKMKPARPVRITRTIAGTTYTLFAGHTDDNPINPDVNAKTVTLALVDNLADFRGQNVTTPLYRDIRSGQAIGYILDACGWPATLRDLDVGATIIPWWWEDGTDALNALERVLSSEGPPALLTVGTSGEIVFRDRHHRLTRAEALTSQSTWRSSGGLEPVMQAPFEYDEAWRNIINTGTVSVDVRQPQPSQVVWTSDTTIGLTAGEQRLVTASGSDPFYNAIVPIDGIDYRALSGSVTAELLRTSGTAATIKLTAIGGAATIAGLQLRAQPVTVAYTVQVSASDPQSIADYGPRSFPSELPWCGVGDAQAVLDAAVSQRAQPLPIVQARFLIRDPAKAASLLSRDLSDRVTVIEAETATNGDFYIESIRHDLTGEEDHSITFGLEAAPTGATPTFRFDTAGAGFNDGKFGSGLSDSANMFRFDGTSGHRFNEGVFAQ